MNAEETNRRCCSRRNPIRKWLIGRRLRKLKLDEHQLEQLDELMASAWVTGRACGHGDSKVRRALVELMNEEGFDRDGAVDLIRTEADRQVERATGIAAAFGDFYQGLESWQQSELQRVLGKRGHCRSCCGHRT